MYPCLKEDQTFTTTRAEILAYLGLNIPIGIHELPQLAMCWDSDKFIGVEGFKKMIPKHNFTTLGKYLHLADLTKEDWNYLLCKVCPLVAHLEQKFAKALTPGKNITVGEGHVNLLGGFPSSRTFQWSLMNLVANFGFLLKLTHIMFHTKNQTVSYFKENISLLMFFRLFESSSWIIIRIFSLKISSHLLIWCKNSKH